MSSEAQEDERGKHRSWVRNGDLVQRDQLLKIMKWAFFPIKPLVLKAKAQTNEAGKFVVGGEYIE